MDMATAEQTYKNKNTEAERYEKEYNDIGWNDLDIKTVKENFWGELVIKLEKPKSEEQKFKKYLDEESFKKHRANFIEYLTTHGENINKILNRYNIGMISATTYNDYYKFTMSGVIFKVEEYFNNNNNIRVTFGIDIRKPDIASELLEACIHKKELYKKLISNLNKLKTRYFNQSIFEDIKKKDISHIWTPENIAKLAGKPLIDEVIELEQQGNEVIELEQQGNEVIEQGDKVVEPDKQNEKVTISIYVGPDNKPSNQDEKQDNQHEKQDNPDIKQKLYIEATGPWHRVTWLETSLMQCVYKTVLEDYLYNNKKSYEQWLLESMFRCYLSIDFANKLNTDNNIIKGALFSGRRTGSFLFTMIQVYMMETLYNNYLGSSSVDAWFQLKNIVNQSSQTNDTTDNIKFLKLPIGTHAHEMSMVLSSLFPELDKTIVGSQILGHYLYYLFVNKKTEIPMLPDTLGTDAFMLAANYIKVDDDKPFITKINKARQDSGTTEGFKEKMAIWKYKGELMASEIEDTDTLETANKQRYDTFGAGGFFGDSEKVWNVLVDNQESNVPVNNPLFSASMAVKAIRVLVSNTDKEIKEINRYPVKLGDGTGKETAYTRLSITDYNTIIKEKIELKEKGIEATEALEEKGKEFRLDISFLNNILELNTQELNQQESTQLESKLNTQELFNGIVNEFKSLDNKSTNTAEKSNGGNRIRKTRKKRRNGNYLHNKSKRKGGKRRTRRL